MIFPHVSLMGIFPSSDLQPVFLLLFLPQTHHESCSVEMHFTFLEKETENASSLLTDSDQNKPTVLLKIL